MRQKRLTFLLILSILIVAAGVFAFSITLNVPANNQIFGPKITAGFPLVTVNITVDSFANITLANFTIGGVEICSNNTVNLSSYQCTWNTSQTGNGNFTVIANATNSSGGSAIDTNTGVIVDSINATAVINSPANATNTSDTTPEIQFTLTDNIDFTINFTIFVDGAAGQTGGAPNGTATKLNLTALTEGTHLIVVEARDDANNTGNSTPLTLTVDTTDPAITLNSPANGTSTTNTSLTFNWTAVDNLATSMSCDLNIDSAVNTAGVTSPNNTATTTTASSLSVATHTWNVTCTDAAGNSNTSFTRTFTITSPPSTTSSGGGGGSSSFYQQKSSADETAIEPYPCIKDWFCQQWSDCVNDKQTRTCALNDYAECTQTAPKPAETRICNEPVIVEPPAPQPTITPPQTVPVAEDVLVTVTQPSNTTGWTITGLIFVLAIIGGIWYFGFRKQT